MRSSERLVALGGIGLAVASFVPWYEPDEFAFEGSRTNGWEDPDAFLSQLGTVAGVVLAVVVVLVSRQADRPTPGNLRWGRDAPTVRVRRTATERPHRTWLARRAEVQENDASGAASVLKCSPSSYFPVSPATTGASVSAATAPKTK
jgi:hypothetical protein